MSQEEKIIPDKKVRDSIRKARNAMTFSSVIDKLRSSHGYTISRIAQLADVDRTAVSRWISNGAVPHEPTLKTLKEGLEAEGLGREAEQIEDMLKPVDIWGDPADTMLDRISKAAEANMSVLPETLYTPDDAMTIALNWPHGSDMDFIFAEGKYSDRGTAWDVTHKEQSALESLQGIQKHDEQMTILKKFGITADTIREGALYYKSSPENVSDLPRQVRGNVITNRLGALIKESVCWGRNTRALGKKLLYMISICKGSHDIIMTKKGLPAYFLSTMPDLVSEDMAIIPDIMRKLFDIREIGEKDDELHISANSRCDEFCGWFKENGYDINNMYEENDIPRKAWFFTEPRVHRSVLEEKKDHTLLLRPKFKGGSNWNKDLVGFRKKYADTKDPSNNIILGEDLMLVMDDTKKHIKPGHLKNRNVLVVGAPGSGKSCGHVYSNIMQMNASYITTELFDEISRPCSKALEANGYEVQVLNLDDPHSSIHYNPLDHVCKENGTPDEKKIKPLVSAILANTGFDSRPGMADPFWVGTARAWVTFAILYLIENCTESDRDLAHVCKLTGHAYAADDIDMLVKNVKRPDALFVKYYDSFMLAPKQTRQAVLASLALALQAFRTADALSTDYKCQKNRDRLIKHYAKDDDGHYIKTVNNIDFASLRTKKTAVFVSINPSNPLYRLVTAVLFTQTMLELYQGSAENNNGLPVHIFLDEFEELGCIPGLELWLATTRKYKIGCSMMMKSLHRIKKLYPDCWEEIIGNCDSRVFMGTPEPDTCKYFTSLLGKTTVRAIKQGKSSMAVSDLTIDTAEVALTDNSKEIVMVSGEAPFYISKFRPR